MKIEKTVKIMPGAQVFGDVEIAEDCSIWHGAIIRGDSGPIHIGKGSNVQDNCVLHSSPGLTLSIGENVSIGHGAVVHGCTIEDNVLIGMNATVLNNAKIGKNSIVGAGAVVSEGKEFPEGSLILGVPGKAIKETTEEQKIHIKYNAEHYVKLSKTYDNEE
ncbi:MAG: gamma carbonic anhydrase family protein [archaeon]|nr:gamma carbonic anhydrase family protein [archaeon]